MGSTIFTLPKQLTPAAIGLIERACFAGGYDQTPVPTLSEVEDHRLYISRALSESGYLLVPWNVPPHGTFVTTTSTLRECDEPYPFLIELARGKLNQVRTQAAEWQLIGLQASPGFISELTETTRLFGKAVLDPTAPEADATAILVLERSFGLANRLVRMYTEQVLATRHHECGKLESRWAARYTSAPTGDTYAKTFNAASVFFRWRDIEPSESDYRWAEMDAAIDFATARGLPITIGPVLDISTGMLPDWAAGWGSDLPTLAAFMCDYLETVIARYRDRVRRWVICSGFNHNDGLGLSDDDRLRLAARLFESASQLDPELDMVLGIAQPWGDYLIHEDQTISPLAFADDLIRAGLRIAAVEVELRFGNLPRGSLPRDLLDTSRVLEIFGVLGIPLEILLSYPAQDRLDERAAAQGESLWSPGWDPPPSAESQAEWGALFAALTLCKPHIRAVTWDHWSDADPHLMPQGGLLDSSGAPRPLLEHLRLIRSEHLH